MLKSSEYRAEDPHWGKSTSAWFADPADVDKPFKEIHKQRVEVLGRGQQFVAYHTHPDTGNPDMEVTVNRFNSNGEEETVTMSARDWLDYIREQEEVAKDDIEAVRALASCALKYGSEAA